MLPAEGHSAWRDMEIFPSLPSGWPLSAGEGVARERAPHPTVPMDGAEVGCLPGRLIHPPPGPAGGDVIW